MYYSNTILVNFNWMPESLNVIGENISILCSIHSLFSIFRNSQDVGICSLCCSLYLFLVVVPYVLRQSRC